MPQNNRLNKLAPELDQLHKFACEKQMDYYLDPKTGYKVFTADYHKKRGKCCDSGCRHCPYHEKTTAK